MKERDKQWSLRNFTKNTERCANRTKIAKDVRGMVKDELQEKDYSLEETVSVIKKHYESMANKMEELAKQLRGELENK